MSSTQLTGLGQAIFCFAGGMIRPAREGRRKRPKVENPGHRALASLFDHRNRDDLSRANVMKQAASLKVYHNPVVLPGITINTGSTDFHPIKPMRLVQFDGTAWQPIGDVIEDAFVGTHSERCIQRVLLGVRISETAPRRRRDLDRYRVINSPKPHWRANSALGPGQGCNQAPE
jgi:hypothetical protein